MRSLKTVERLCIQRLKRKRIIPRTEEDDLLDSNIFKLNKDDDTYYIPLWHNELYFNS